MSSETPAPDHDGSGDAPEHQAMPGGTAPPTAVAPFDAAAAEGHQRAWADHLGVPVETTCSIGVKMALVPAGELKMGSPEPDTEAWNDEKPEHVVRITRPFYVGVCPVTQEQFQRVMGENPSWFAGGPNRPVEYVSWEDAQEFCRRLSALPEEEAAGSPYQLPTEAEWEFVCRAGTTGKWSFGEDESAFADHGWYHGNSSGETQPIAQKKPNAWGLYDIHGNVWEWCADWYVEDYYAASPSKDPTGPASGLYRVLRGGSWYFGPADSRSASRGWNSPLGRYNACGFRIISSL